MSLRSAATSQSATDRFAFKRSSPIKRATSAAARSRYAFLNSRSTNGPSPPFSSSSALPTRSWLVIAITQSLSNKIYETGWGCPAPHSAKDLIQPSIFLTHSQTLLTASRVAA